MELTTWFTLAGICFMGASSPGPSLGVVLGNTVSGGRSAGVATGVGHGIGVGIYATLAVAGLAVVITTAPTLFVGFQVAAALFLAWLGVQMLRPGQAKDETEGSDTARCSPRQGFIEGFLIAFLNPKIAVFFLALFSQFVDPQASVIEKLGMGFMAGFIDLAWYVAVALAIAGTGIGAWLQARARTFDIIMGTILLAVAVALGGRLLIS